MIQIQELTKRFGNLLAVDHVSLHINKGEIFGLLGENGAGKTTTLRLLATLLTPTSGTATIGGVDLVADPAGVRRQLGVIFEGGIYDRLTARENMRYFGKLYAMRGEELEKRINKIIALLDMSDYADERVVRFSKGMRQKVAIGRSIVHDPEILLMDEPTAGLDVTAARLVHDFVIRIREEGKTILFSSHNMTEVQKLCNRVAIIHRGRIVAEGSIDDLKQSSRQKDFEELFVRLVGDER